MARGGQREWTVRIEMPLEDGAPRFVEKRVKVRISAGITPGKRIRLAGMGGEGQSPGDLFLTVELEPHPFFSLEGRHVLLRLPIAPWEAALGARVRIPLYGEVELKLPPGSQSGYRLRGQSARGWGAGFLGRHEVH